MDDCEGTDATGTVLGRELEDWFDMVLSEDISFGGGEMTVSFAWAWTCPFSDAGGVLEAAWGCFEAECTSCRIAGEVEASNSFNGISRI